MKIFAAGIATETNTFSLRATVFDDFRIQRGVDLLTGRAEYPDLDLSDPWGNQARNRGDEFIFSLMAYAEPGGPTENAAYERLRDDVLADLRAAMPVDIVLLMLHGAMIAQSYEDCEEDLIRCVRAVAGPKAVLAVEFDLHCHLRQSKIANADLAITYKEYPHTDSADRARELFELAVATRLGRIRPTMALFDCCMVGLYPTSRQPMRGLVDALSAGERREGVLSISFAHGFPFADFPHIGATMLAVTDSDAALARQVAKEFALKAYSIRDSIGCESFSLPLEAALARALRSSERPVVVADQSDNPGGGAPGDATHVLRWLIERKVDEVGIAFLFDPEAVRLACRAGRGARIHVQLGGKSGSASGYPVDLDVTVIGLATNYRQPLPQLSGTTSWIHQGTVVALRSAGIDIIATDGRGQCLSPTVFSDFGIDPTAKRLLIPKSAQHFYAAFSQISSEIIYMSAPGAVVPDPRRLPYRNVPTQRLYPWTEDPLGEMVG